MCGLDALANAANRAPLRRIFNTGATVTTSSFSPATAQGVFSEQPAGDSSAWHKLEDDPVL